MLNIFQELSPTLFETWVDYLHPLYKPRLAPESLGFSMAVGKLTASVIWHDMLHTLYNASKHYTVHNIKDAIKARLRVITRHSASMQAGTDRDFVLSALVEPEVPGNALGH